MYCWERAPKVPPFIPGDNDRGNYRTLQLSIVFRRGIGSVIAMASYALIGGSRIGWASPIIIGSAIFAVVLLVTAVLRARRRANPLIPLQIFANRSFVRGSFTSVLGFAAAAGFLYLAPQYLRNIEGLSSVEAGLASALYSTAKQFGQLIGIAAVSTLLIAASPTFHTAYDDIGPWAWLMLAACGVMVVALNLTSHPNSYLRGDTVRVKQ